MNTNELQRGDEVEVVYHFHEKSVSNKGIVTSATRKGIYVANSYSGHFYKHNKIGVEIKLIYRHGLMQFKRLFKLSQGI